MDTSRFFFSFLFSFFFFFFLHMDIWLFQNICWNDYSFSTELPLNLCWKSVVHICVGLFLGSLFHSIDLFVCLYASTTLSWLRSFVSLEISECEASSSFALHFQSCLAVPRPLHFHLISESVGRFLSKKKPAEILTGIAQNLEIRLGSSTP